MTSETKGMGALIGIGVVGVIIVIVVVIVTVTRQQTENTTDSPVPPPATSSVRGAPDEPGGPIHDEAHDPDEPSETPAEPEDPTVDDGSVEDGTDHFEDEPFPADQIEPLVDSTNEFWEAFSLRDPDERNAALEPVTVEWLLDQLKVDDTYRIPVIEPRKTVVIDGNYIEATTVTEAEDGNWYFTSAVFEPFDEKWQMQRVGEATPELIADAKEVE